MSFSFAVRAMSNREVIRLFFIQLSPVVFHRSEMDYHQRFGR